MSLAKFQQTEDLDFLYAQDSLLTDIALNFPDERFHARMERAAFGSDCREEDLPKRLAGYLLTGGDFDRVQAKLDAQCGQYEVKEAYLKAMQLTSGLPVRELILHNWLTYTTIDEVGFEYLSRQADVDLEETLLAGFYEGEGELTFVCDNYECELIRKMFARFTDAPDEVKSSIIQHLVRRMNSHQLHVLEKLSKTINTPSTGFRKAVLASMASSDYAFGVFERFKIIMPHLNEETKERLTEIFRENTKWDTGNWTATFTDEFKRLKLDV